MSRFERVLLIILVLIATVLWVTVGYKLAQAWQEPLGPSMALPTLTPSPQQAAISAPRPTVGPTTTTIPGHPTLTPYSETVATQPQCGGPATMTVLAVGSDTRSQSYLYGLADVIRLVRVDFITPRVTVLDFPRDLWVEIPDISAHYNITHGKLNQAYLLHRRRPGAGPAGAHA
jgi:hypothetical protein